MKTAKSEPAPAGAGFIAVASCVYASQDIWTKQMGDYLSSFSQSVLRASAVAAVLPAPEIQ